MRSGQIRNRYVQPILLKLSDKITDILVSIQNGGWEVWLQMDLALELSSRLNGKFHRERLYEDGSGGIYNLHIETDRGATIYLELKAQKSQDDDTTANRMLNDIQKIKQLDQDFKTKNLVVSMAVSRLTNQTEFANFKLLVREGIHAYSERKQFQQRLMANELRPNTLTLFWFDPHEKES